MTRSLITLADHERVLEVGVLRGMVTAAIAMYALEHELRLREVAHWQLQALHLDQQRTDLQMRLFDAQGELRGLVG